MATPLERILDAPSVPLGQWPTPVSAVHLDRTGEILVKRDDLSGHGRGGVKTRKIEMLVRHLIEGGHDHLVTPVGNVTNLVHDLLPVLRRHGIGWEIVVADDPHLPTAQRESMFRGLGEGVRLLGPGRLGVTLALARALHRSRRAGRRPFLAMPSLAHPAGVIASARGFLEMVGQVDATVEPPLRTVFITAASGTTLAGFLLAENLLRRQGHPPIRVVGVQVYPGPARRWVQSLVRWTEAYLRVTDHLPYGRIEVRTSRLHGGFGRYPPALGELCRSVATETGLAIDPIFGGKTWSVMESSLAREPRRGAVLFWHCGYTPDWEALDPLVNPRAAGGVH